MIGGSGGWRTAARISIPCYKKAEVLLLDTTGYSALEGVTAVRVREKSWFGSVRLGSVGFGSVRNGSDGQAAGRLRVEGAVARKLSPPQGWEGRFLALNRPKPHFAEVF